MAEAPKPSNEKERLEVLRKYKILDSEPEIEYDAIVQLATLICGMPIALISLVDNNRQWFKSKKGLEVEETDRDVSFCAHCILDSKPMMVENALDDPRFSDNALVTGEPGIRFYAGAPLISPSGHRLGTLCVIDNKANQLSQEKLAALEALAGQVMTQMELRRINRRLQDLLVDFEKNLHSTQAEALQGMAESVAHEVNNPLTIIAGLTEHCISMSRDPQIDTEKMRLNLRRIHDMVFRISDVLREIRDIQTLSKTGN